MEKQQDDGLRVTFLAPSELVEAAQAAAKEDTSSVSYLCRRALTSELERRGLLRAKTA